MSVRVVRVAVVHTPEGGRARPMLRDAGLEVVAEVPNIGDLLTAPSHEHAAAIVACGPSDLGDERFNAQLTRLARRVPTVLVVPRVTRRAAAVAGRARVLGLLSQQDASAHLARVVRSVVRGEIAYPSEALAALFRLLRPAAPRGASPAQAT